MVGLMIKNGIGIPFIWGIESVCESKRKRRTKVEKGVLIEALLIRARLGTVHRHHRLLCMVQ